MLQAAQQPAGGLCAPIMPRLSHTIPVRGISGAAPGAGAVPSDPKQSAPLMFDKPEINTQPYLAIAAREQTLFTANRVAYPSETGYAYLFPSQILHGYEMPTRGGERISLAFNVMLTGIGQFYKL